MPRSRWLALPFVLPALVGLAACGSEPEEPGQSARPVKAVATTTQVGDFVREVGGSRVAVRQILQPNSDPHDYEPRPSDGRAIEGAQVVFRSGGDLDEWMGDLIKSNGGDARTVELIKSVRTRKGEEEHHEGEEGEHAEEESEHAEEEEHGHGETDPHWWQDPRNAEKAVAAIRDNLVKADPDGADGYRKRAAAYTKQLKALDTQVADCIDKLPRSERKLVTSHDALGYYTDRYGLTLVGAIIPSLSTQAQPSSKDVNALVDQIREEKVKAIFPESSLNPKLEQAVARESGAQVGGALWADTLGPRGSKGATYIGSIRDNTSKIASGLSAGADRCQFGGS